MAAGATRPALTSTPSSRSRLACSRCSRDFAGNTMRPPAPTTRCQGRFMDSPGHSQGISRLTGSPRQSGGTRDRAVGRYLAAWNLADDIPNDFDCGIVRTRRLLARAGPFRIKGLP